MGFCVVQLLESLLAPDGTRILSEFDCPLFELTYKLSLVSSCSIVSAISMIHSCADSCAVTESSWTHDLSSNKMFYFNIFCIP